MSIGTRSQIVAAIAAAALGVAVLAEGPPREQRLPIERAAPRAAVFSKDLTCAGGPEALAQIELIPDAVIKTGSRERIEYHGEISSKRGKALGVAWSADVVDDRGQIVRAGIEKGQGRGKGPSDAIVTRAISADLPDGFFFLRLQAAIAADGEPSDVLQAEQFLEVRDGLWIELDEADWRSRSRATLAFVEASTTEPEGTR